MLFGRSGLEVTLIDYGLSRAKLPNGDIAYCDLEEDLAVFCGEDGNSQYDTYRRYVSIVFTYPTRKVLILSQHEISLIYRQTGHVQKLLAQ